jgi:hypothetical protein
MNYKYMVISLHSSTSARPFSSRHIIGIVSPAFLAAARLASSSFFSLCPRCRVPYLDDTGAAAIVVADIVDVAIDGGEISAAKSRYSAPRLAL